MMDSTSWYERYIRYNASSSRSNGFEFMSFGHYVHNKVTMAIESQENSNRKSLGLIYIHSRRFYAHNMRWIISESSLGLYYVRTTGYCAHSREWNIF